MFFLQAKINNFVADFSLKIALQMSDKSYYSKEGFQKLKAELEFLEQVERPRLSQAISEARDKGDLSENAEYHAAKEEQSLLELKIVKLKATVASARVLDESQIDHSKVLIHSEVLLKNKKTNTQISYTLVADSETDLKAGKLSVNSPIGRGLLGSKVGDIVSIKVPTGILELEIVQVGR